MIPLVVWYAFNRLDGEAESQRRENMINEAIEFATKAHEGQFRKGTKRPYIVHPVEVADIVTSMTQDEEIICAAVLHDTIEDCEGVTAEVLEERFGQRVASLVQYESEDKTKTWEERKRATIHHLREVPREAQMIALADKLSNMRDIDRDYPKFGEAFWLRFRMQSKAAIGWYYKSIRDVLKENFEDICAYQEYCQLVQKHFGEEPASMVWKAEIKRSL